MITCFFVLLTSTAQVQLKSVKVFQGGPISAYMRFVSSSGVYPNGINVFPEQIFMGAGPVRRLEFSDGSLRFDPPLLTQFRYKFRDTIGHLESTLLPEHYCRFDNPAPVNNNDEIAFLQTSIVNNSAPGIVGSFYMGNGLPALGFKTKIHPFFKDMRVTVRYSGNWKPTLLTSIANCIGGTVLVNGNSPTEYEFEPNVEEIRTRALVTLDYFTPRLESEAGALIDSLKYRLIKTSSTEFMKRWIDAAGTRDRYALTNEPWASDVRKYRDLMIEQRIKARGKKGSKYTADEYKAMAMYIELADYLNFGIILIGSDGVEHWI